MKKSKGTLTVEQMVRKCFMEGLNYRLQYGLNNRNATTFCCAEVYRLLARAARRFCRMEERQKAEQSHLKFLDECRDKGIQQGVIKLPKHFGEMRFKAACRKTNKGVA